MLVQTIAETSGWLFIGLWSISETPDSLRREVWCNAANIDSYLIAYQNRFGDIDNTKLFADWMESHSEIAWTSTEIPHLPGNHYLFGLRS
jgi:hypothetical protein